MVRGHRWAPEAERPSVHVFTAEQSGRDPLDPDRPYRHARALPLDRPRAPPGSAGRIATAERSTPVAATG
jgi:hypothetical protein